MMGVHVEARYLRIDWANRQDISKFEVGEPLDIVEGENGWLLESTVFNGYYPRLGFRILDQQILHTPYFLDSGGRRQEMLAVTDPNGIGCWWIQNSGWDESACRIDSELQRTVGRADAIIQERQLGILNHSSNFTVEELESCLADFKDDLWMLLLNEHGSVKGSLNNPAFSRDASEIIATFRNFTAAVERILAAPVLVLKETIDQRPIKAVRPIARTFAEMASRGLSRKLSSRGFVKSMNTAENQYVHYVLSRVSQLVRNLWHGADRSFTRYTHHAEAEKTRADQYRNQTIKEIDPAVFKAELIERQRREADVLAAVEADKSRPRGERGEQPSRPLDQGVRLRLADVVLSVDRKYGGMSGQFFCNHYDGRASKELHHSYMVVEFPECIATALVALGNPGQRFRISGEAMKATRWTKSDPSGRPGKKYTLLQFIRISELDFEGETPAQRRSTRMDYLEANGWQLPLDKKGRTELATEANRSQARAERFARQAMNSRQLSLAAQELTGKLSRLRSALRQQGVAVRSEFPSSMVFVRNPDYLACKVEFDRILQKMQLGSGVFDALEKVENIGLLHVSSLYERWCFLQIIGVLCERLGFTPLGDWKEQLLEGILARKHDTTLEFLHADTDFRIALTYEKVLPNGRRPDFVLDIDSPSYSHRKDVVGEDESGGWYRDGVKSTRLVMDAKFRDEWRFGELSNVVEELRVSKGYAREASSDRVFVLHPCASSIAASARSSPLVWGHHSDYGQNSEHTHGSIFLSPRDECEDIQEGLHRLLGMVLQSEFAFLHYGAGGRFWSNACCFSCGKKCGSGGVTVSHDYTERMRDVWIVSCETCQLRSVKTCCYECGHDLYKNGFQWTYHTTLAEQISNVVCPSCRAFL